MHSSALLTSALAVGALALPQGQLEKRQQATVTVTVYVNPYANPAWTPPQFSQTPNTRRPANAPPLWTPPNIVDPKTRATLAPVNTARSSSATSRPAVSTTSSRATSSPSLSSSSAVIGAPISAGPTTSSAVIGEPVSAGSASSAVNVPAVSSSAATTTALPSSIGPSHISGTAQAALSTGTDYQNAILYHHNEARANHNAQELVWCDTCAENAALAANMCNFTHYIPSGAGEGQNLFTTSGDYFNVTAGITESWYKGEFQAMLPYFGQANIPDDVFHNVGHLTQVLWKATTGVGCVSIDCGTRMTVGGVSSTLNKYTVCNYAPAGNVAGEYDVNVGVPISTTDLGSWTD